MPPSSRAATVPIASPVSGPVRRPFASSPVPEESHICGAFPCRTILPPGSRTVTLPVASMPSVPPLTWIPIGISASRGSRAASGVFTTSTCEKPSRPADSLRSTPGNTSSYVAVSYSGEGFGSGAGQV